MKNLPDCRVTVVGLGLMGGSMAGALRGHCREVVGVARRIETIETATEASLIDWGTTDLSRGVRDADIVLLATPVRVIIDQLRQVPDHVSKGCLLIDLGSTKAEIVKQMADLPGFVQPVGGHPMCGKEVSGISAADPDLFRGSTFVLTPLPRTTDDALGLARQLVETIGSIPLILEPAEHDVMVAVASHLPYLLACTLVDTAQSVASTDTVVWRLAASGFRDTSRLAGSDVKMMVDILLTNREHICDAIGLFEAKLKHVAAILESADEPQLHAHLGTIQDSRRQNLTA